MNRSPRDHATVVVVVVVLWASACADGSSDDYGTDSDASTYAGQGPDANSESDSERSGSTTDSSVAQDAGDLGSGGSGGNPGGGDGGDGSAGGGGGDAGGSGGNTGDSGGNTSDPVGLTCFFGGFSIGSTADVQDAVGDGMQATLLYGTIPSPSSGTGQALAANHMYVIDGRIEDYIYKYAGQSDLSGLVSDVTSYLQTSKDNSLVIGYWVLDDWNGNWGAGKEPLKQMNALIHQIAPGRKSICGFGGGLSSSGNGIAYWDDGLAENFSPEGCDMVGLYIYGESGGSASDYDWTMPNVIAAAFDSLKKRGWDIDKTPLVGIPQAFGGGHWVVPSADSVETQAKTWCQKGATSIIYYAWHDDATVNQLPGNNPGIKAGILAGNTDCKGIWGIR